MISINSTVRFPTLSALKRKAKSLNWVRFEHAEDARGFYATAVELDPKVAAVINELDAKARANRLARAIDDEIADAGKPERKPRPVKTDGPVHQIRAWVRENPNATRDEAVEHFTKNYGFNPATVKIQMRKVKLGLV